MLRKANSRLATYLLVLATLARCSQSLADAGRELPTGTLHENVYYSKTLEKERAVCVYTPAGYDPDRPRTYPTLYLLHGWGNDEKAWVSLGNIDRCCDVLVGQHKMTPMIIVMPQGHAGFPGIAPPPNGRPPTSTEALEGDFFNDMIPFVESHYRIERTAQSRAIAGLSMGGRQALFIGLNHPEMLRWVAGFSAAIRDCVYDHDYQDIVENAAYETKNMQLIWLGCGWGDPCFDANRQFHDWLDAKQIRHTWHPSNGGHEWTVWRDYLDQILRLLFKQPPQIAQ